MATTMEKLAYRGKAVLQARAPLGNFPEETAVTSAALGRIRLRADSLLQVPKNKYIYWDSGTVGFFVMPKHKEDDGFGGLTRHATKTFLGKAGTMRSLGAGVSKWFGIGAVPLDALEGDALPRWVSVVKLRRHHTTEGKACGRAPRMVSLGKVFTATYRLADAQLTAEAAADPLLGGRICAQPLEAYRMLADRYEARMIRGWTHAAALHELESVAGLPAGWRGARPYVGVYEPWKLRVSWTLAWLLVLAELGFFLAEWLTLTTRETAGECAQTMLVAFFVAPLSGIAARAVLMFGLTALTSLVFARRAARLERRRKARMLVATAGEFFLEVEEAIKHKTNRNSSSEIRKSRKPRITSIFNRISKPVRVSVAGAFSPRRSKASKEDPSAASDEASAELSRRVSVAAAPPAARAPPAGGGDGGRKKVKTRRRTTRAVIDPAARAGRRTRARWRGSGCRRARAAEAEEAEQRSRTVFV